jgi:hypothetical protein
METAERDSIGAKTVPNKGVELTASSVRSSLAPASSRSSRLAFGSAWRTWDGRRVLGASGFPLRLLVSGA